jgi:hypothetical protein
MVIKDKNQIDLINMINHIMMKKKIINLMNYLDYLKKILMSN